MISQIEIWFNKVGFHVVSCFVSISSCHVHRWGFRLQSAPVRCVDQSARPSDSGLVRVCVVGSSHCLYFVPWFCSVYVGSSLLLSVTFILSCFDGDKFVHSVFWWVKTLHTSAICPFWEGSLLPAHTCDTIRVHTLAWHILRNTTSNKKSLWIFFSRKTQFLLHPGWKILSNHTEYHAPVADQLQGHHFDDSVQCSVHLLSLLANRSYYNGFGHTRAMQWDDSTRWKSATSLHRTEKQSEPEIKRSLVVQRITS